MPQYQGVWSLQQQMQALTSGQWATDPLFDYTTLLLQGDAGANGAQNNVFYDTSPNQFAITRNGNTTQGTFSPFSATGWSNFFDGTGDYLTSTVSSVGSSGDLTVEGWVYPTASGVRRTFFFVGSTGTFDLNLFTEITTANVLRFLIRNDSVIDILDISSTATVSANTWSHVAFVLSGTSATIYLNGVSVATGTLSGARTGTFTTGSIGALLSGGATHYFNGYISNLRYVKGTAVYTAAFTPPTAPLTAITNTSLLTCQSNRFIDNSSNAYTITRNGDTSVQAFSPFAPQFQYTASGTGGSGYFDGSGDYLTTNNINLAANAFTIEGWFYVTTTAGNMNYWGMSNGGGSTPKAVLYMDNVGNLVFETGAVSGAVISVSISTYVKRNAWQHIAISRSGTGASQTAMFIDGVRVGTGTCASLSGITAGFNIGYVGEGFGVTFNGYIAGFRIVNGTAVYNPASTTVTIPTAPLTAVTNTALLTNFTNAGILDGTMKNNLETVGNAQVSTSVVKYGSGSMYFDGTGDYLKLPSNALYAFGTGAYTIEFWIYPSSLAAGSYHVIGANATNGIVVIISNAKVALNKYGVGDVLAYNTALTTSTWSHVAVVRESTGTNQTKIYVNGTSVATGTDSNDWTVTTNFGVGANTSDGSQAINGYLDDLRVTKGIARYTQNFIPPSVALPRQ
jgi:hypothetical protein